MKEKSRLIRKIIRLQREEGIIPRGARLLVAFSGGVDSVTLTVALLELKDFLRLKDIALAHFNHKLRPTSDRDEEFCKNFAEERNLKIFVGSKEVAKIAKEKGTDLEETARELRYRFLRSVKEEEGFDLIATAHHLNDLVETVLIWLTRGAGLEGLIGFDPKENDIVRPLYRATRKEIEDFAKACGLRWVEDESNRDQSFYRNRLRHTVIPILKEVNPNLEETVLRMRTVLKEEHLYMKGLALKALEKAKASEECLWVEELKGLHPALQRRVLKDFFGVENFSKLEQIRKLLEKGGRAELGGGIRVVRKGKLLCLKKDR